MLYYGGYSDLDRALTWLNRAVDYSHDVLVKTQMAALYLERDSPRDSERARNLLEEVVRSDAEAELRASAASNLGLLLEAEGDLAAAEEQYRTAARGGRANGMSNLAMLLEEKGDLRNRIAARWWAWRGSRKLRTDPEQRVIGTYDVEGSEGRGAQSASGESFQDRPDRSDTGADQSNGPSDAAPPNR